MLSVNLSKALRARKIQITFEGKEHTHTEKERVGYPDGEFENRYLIIHDEQNILVTESTTVWENPKGGNLGPCNELFPFEFQIPEQTIPSVVTRGKDYALIMYEIVAKIDKPLAIDPAVHSEVLVLPKPHKAYRIEPMDRTREDPEGKMLLNVHADKTIFVPGEHVTGKIVFKKDPSLYAESIVIAVIYTGSVTTEGETQTSRMEADEANYEIDPHAEYFEIPFDLAIPEDARRSVHGNLIKRLWELEVKVNVLSKGIEKINLPLIVVPNGGDT